MDKGNRNSCYGLWAHLWPRRSRVRLVSLQFMEDFRTVLAVCVECQTVDTVQTLVRERPLLLSEGGSGSWPSSLLFPLCLSLGWKQKHREQSHGFTGQTHPCAAGSSEPGGRAAEEQWALQQPSPVPTRLPLQRTAAWVWTCHHTQDTGHLFCSTWYQQDLS